MAHIGSREESLWASKAWDLLEGELCERKEWKSTAAASASSSTVAFRSLGWSQPPTFHSFCKHVLGAGSMPAAGPCARDTRFVQFGLLGDGKVRLCLSVLENCRSKQLGSQDTGEGFPIVPAQLPMKDQHRSRAQRCQQVNDWERFGGGGSGKSCPHPCSSWGGAG